MRKMGSEMYPAIRNIKQWQKVKEKFIELMKTIVIEFPPEFADKYKKIIEGIMLQFDLDLYMEVMTNPMIRNWWELPRFCDRFEP